MVKDTDPVRGTRISLDLLSLLILDRDSWDSCSFPWTIFNWLSDDVNISTSCVRTKAVNSIGIFSVMVFSMPDTETEKDTETEIDTDKLAQNSMGICVKCLSLLCEHLYTILYNPFLDWSRCRAVWTHHKGWKGNLPRVSYMVYFTSLWCIHTGRDQDW